MFADPSTLKDVKAWRAEVDALASQVVGRTAVRLEADRAVCRQFECNLGMYECSNLHKGMAINDLGGGGEIREKKFEGLLQEKMSKAILQKKNPEGPPQEKNLKP